MSSRECPTTPLVHAAQDGRLGEREHRSLERHLATCSACQRAARDLRRIGELGRELGDALGERSELEHRRARLELLREAASPRVVHRRSRPTHAGLAWAAAAMVAGIVMAAAWATDDEPEPRTEHRRRPAPTATVTASASAPEVSIRGSDGARYDRVILPGLDRVRLQSGTIDLTVPRLSDGSRFLVTTADAEVEVRGTDFSVTAVAECVHEVVVREGAVELRRRGQPKLLLRAGQSWRHADAVAAVGPGDGDPSATARPSGPTSTGGAGRAEPPGAQPPSAGPVDVADIAGPVADDPASAAFAAAVGELERKQYERAAQSLAAFARRFPTDPRAEDAHFLTIVAWQRAGRSDVAQGAADRYLERYPDGQRRDEVRKAVGATSGSAGAPH